MCMYIYILYSRIVLRLLVYTVHVDIGNLCTFINNVFTCSTTEIKLFNDIYFCCCFLAVVLAQCALFAEISTEQEERQTTLKYS